MKDYIAIYAEHTRRAGEECLEADPENVTDDVIWVEATDDEADSFEAAALVAPAGRDLFLQRCAATIRENV